MIELIYDRMLRSYEKGIIFYLMSARRMFKIKKEEFESIMDRVTGGDKEKIDLAINIYENLEDDELDIIEAIMFNKEDIKEKLGLKNMAKLKRVGKKKPKDIRRICRYIHMINKIDDKEEIDKLNSLTEDEVIKENIINYLSKTYEEKEWTKIDIPNGKMSKVYLGMSLYLLFKIEKKVKNIDISLSFEEQHKELINLNDILEELKSYYFNIDFHSDFENDKWNHEKIYSYYPGPSLKRYIETFKFHYKYNKLFSKVNIKMTYKEIENKIETIKFVLLGILIRNNPFTSNLNKVVSNRLTNTLQSALYNSEIYSMVVDSYRISQINDVEKRGAKDRTTQIQFFFSLENEDCYCIRVDFPHKGEPSLHINTHEIGRPTALPMEINEYEDFLEKIKEEKEDLNELFFFYENKYWFRNRFSKKLEDSSITSNSKEIISKEYKRRGHFEIVNKEVNENKLIEIFEEYKVYFQIFINNRVEPMPKEIINIEDTLTEIALERKIRALLLTYYEYFYTIEENKSEKWIKRTLENFKESIIVLLRRYKKHLEEIEELKGYEFLEIVDYLY